MIPVRYTCLTIRDDHLFIEDCDTVELARQFGTPLFVISEAQLRANVRRFQAAFADQWPDGPVDVLPALKANTTLATRYILTQEGAGADVYSAGELHGALQTGADPARISVNGGGKSADFIRTCIEAGVRITIEDLDEPALIEQVARDLDQTARVRLRVKPNFPALWKKTDFVPEYASIDFGIQTYKSGIPAQYLPDLGRQILAMDHVELTGLHFHAGRHRAGLWYWDRLMRGYGRLIAELCAAWDGYHPAEIDIGGGFAAPRDPHSKLDVGQDVVLSWLSWPLQLALYALPARLRYRLLARIVAWGFAHDPALYQRPGGDAVPTVEAYAAAAVQALREELANGGVDTTGTRLQVEPGRALYGDAGLHLTTIKKVKRQTDPLPMNWVLTDTTYFFLCGGVLEYNLHDFRVANKMDAPPVQLADVVGHSCYGDRILPFVRVPDVGPGDVIALLDTGAYQESSASNFNALPRPATVLVRGDTAEIIKQAETVEDVYRRDVIPERLRTVEATSNLRLAQSPGNDMDGQG